MCLKAIMSTIHTLSYSLVIKMTMDRMFKDSDFRVTWSNMVTNLKGDHFINMIQASFKGVFGWCWDYSVPICHFTSVACLHWGGGGSIAQLTEEQSCLLWALANQMNMDATVESPWCTSSLV